jgi:S-formylglutathione hydrolase FrmB
VSLRVLDGSPGAPWERDLAGSLDRIVVHSELLASNPLGDPAVRPLYVYRAPGVEAGSERAVPSVYLLQGYFGQVDQWFARTSGGPTKLEQIDATFARGDCPPAIVVLVDAWTSRGGSQFLNSASTGRYLDHICDEVIPFVDARYPTLTAPEHRGVAGKSSGGYGAMILSMLRPDLFGALASHAGDALFECCYQPLFPRVARILRDHFEGSWDVFIDRVESVDDATELEREPFVSAFATYGIACAYTPDPQRPGRALVPFDAATGAPIDEIWARWLALDPVRMAAGHATALRGLRRIYLDAGRGDEFFLDLGASAFSAELTRLEVEHTLELFDGGHFDMSHRYGGAIRELVLALGA